MHPSLLLILHRCRWLMTFVPMTLLLPLGKDGGKYLDVWCDCLSAHKEKIMQSVTIIIKIAFYSYIFLFRDVICV